MKLRNEWTLLLIVDVLLALILLLLVVAAFADGGSAAITVSKPDEPVTWSGLGVWASSVPGMSLAGVLGDVLDKRAAWAIASIRVILRADEDLGGLADQFARPEATGLYLWLTLPACDLDFDAAKLADLTLNFSAAAGRRPDAVEYVNEPYSGDFGDFAGSSHEERAESFRTFSKLLYAELAVRNIHVPMIVQSHGAYVSELRPLGALIGGVDLHQYVNPAADNTYWRPRPSCIPAARKLGNLEGRPRAISTNVLRGDSWLVRGYCRDADAVLEVLIDDTLIATLRGDPANGWREQLVTNMPVEGRCEVCCGEHVWQNVYVVKQSTEEPAGSADYARWLSGSSWIEESLEADLRSASSAAEAWPAGASPPAVAAYGTPAPPALIFGEGGTFYSGHHRCQYGLAAAMLFVGSYPVRATREPIAIHWHGHPHLAGDTPLSWAFEQLARVRAHERLMATTDAPGLYVLASQSALDDRVCVLIVNTLDERSVTLKRSGDLSIWKYSAPAMWHLFARAEPPINGDLCMCDGRVDCDLGCKALPVTDDGTCTTIIPRGMVYIEF